MTLPFNSKKPDSVNLDNWLATMDAGLSVERLHTVRTLQRQSVADHTARAQAIAVDLVDQNPPARLDAVLLHLLQHDVAEQATGDMPADAKQRSPYLTQALVQAEKEWEAEHLIHFNMTPQERAICKMADWLELQQFCVTEREMGNRLIKPVFNNITRYLTNHEYFEHIVGAMHQCSRNLSEWTRILQPELGVNE